MLNYRVWLRSGLGRNFRSAGMLYRHNIAKGGNQSDAVWTSVYHKKYGTSNRVR